MSVLTTPLPSYADSFWDDQYKGVDILSARLRKSKETSEEIKRLYQSRAQIEQEYGDKLLKLSQNTNISQNEEQNSFAETLSQISSTLETTARAHIDLAQKFKDHLEVPLDGFIKEQRDIRKAQQQQIESTKQLRNLHQMDVTRARDHYANECAKLNSMEQQQQQTNNNIEREIEEQRRIVTIAEQVYRRSVDSLNSVNEKWISDWKTASSVFQDLEVSRVKYLINTFWTFSNMMKNTFGIDEDCCDQINTYLGTTDVNQDMMEFVKQNGTGTKLPAHIPYETLYTLPPPPAPPKPQSVSIVNNNNNQPIPPMALQHEQSPVTTVLTNPDEELKSVDQQLQKLEHVLPEQLSTPLSPKNITNNSREIRAQQHHETEMSPYLISMQPPRVELAPLTPTLLGIEKMGSSNTSIRSLEQEEEKMKYKPKPNPTFNVMNDDMNDQNEPKPPSVIVNARTSSLNSPSFTGQAKRHTLIMNNNEDDNEEENPKATPPKDEKWMISSIRRPQQMPINSRHAKVIDSSSSIHSRASLPPQEKITHYDEKQQQQQSIGKSEEIIPTSGIKQYQPKMHRPSVPLTIDIPNQNRLSNSNVLTLAHQVVAQGKQQSSQMSPVLQHQNIDKQQHRNMIRNSLANNNEDDVYPHLLHQHQDLSPQKHYYSEENDHKKRASSTQLPILNKLMSPSSDKPKEKTSSRFSIPFFTGNKKDKKKDKELPVQQVDKRQSHYSSMTSFNDEKRQSALPYNDQRRSQYQQQQSHHLYHQQQQKEDVPELIAANRSSTQLSMNQSQKSPSEHKEYIGYARAMWSFEATIKEEMSFQQGDIIGIIHKQGDGWWMAELIKSERPNKSGLVPGNYMADYQ